MELKNKDTGSHEVLDISNEVFSDKAPIQSDNDVNKMTHAALYIKDKFSIPDQAFHEISMITPGLTSSYKITKLKKSMNNNFDIRPCPNGVVGVQQSLRAHITQHLSFM